MLAGRRCAASWLLCQFSTCLPSSREDRPRNRCAVANIELGARERCTGMPDPEYIWRVEDRRVGGRDPIADRRRNHRMIERKRLDLNAADVGGHT